MWENRGKSIHRNTNKARRQSREKSLAEIADNLLENLLAASESDRVLNQTNVTISF